MEARAAAPRLCVLTGTPGSGKSSAASCLERGLGSAWTVLHADDFIGPTLAFFRRPWKEVRQFHTLWVGWSAGWNLRYPRNVLIEGHIKDEKEVEWLTKGVEVWMNPAPTPFVVWLDDDLETIVRNLTANPAREPTWDGPDRAERFRLWVTTWPIRKEIASRVIDARGKTKERVAADVAQALGISDSTSGFTRL